MTCVALEVGRAFADCRNVRKQARLCGVLTVDNVYWGMYVTIQ